MDAPPPSKKLPDNWEPAHLSTLVAVDRAAIERLGPCGGEIYDAVLQSASQAKLAEFRRSVPMIYTTPEKWSDVTFSGQGIQFLVDDTDGLKRGDDEEEEEDQITVSRLVKMKEGQHTFCVSAAAWQASANDPPPDPIALQCNLDDYESRKLVRAGEVPNGENDPAATAEGWEWAADEKLMSQPTPVRALIVSAYLHNEKLLYSTIKPTKKREEREPAYWVDQPGVVICRASRVYDAFAGTELDNRFVAVLAGHHALAAGMMYAPETANLCAFVNRAVGRFIVGENREGALTVARRTERRVLVAPIEAYRAYLKHLRDRVVVHGHSRMVKAGSLSIRTPPQKQPGSKKKPTSPIVERPICVAATYVQYASCPSLLLAQQCMNLGAGWQSTSLVMGTKVFDNLEKWESEIEDFRLGIIERIKKDENLGELILVDPKRDPNMSEGDAPCVLDVDAMNSPQVVVNKP